MLDRQPNRKAQHQWRFAHRLTSPNVDLMFRVIDEFNRKFLRNVTDVRNFVSGWRIRKQTPIFCITKFFCRQPAQTLNKTAIGLTKVDSFMDGFADIQDKICFFQFQFPGEPVDQNFRYRCSGSVIKKWISLSAFTIVMDIRSPIKTSLTETDSFQPGLINDFSKLYRFLRVALIPNPSLFKNDLSLICFQILKTVSKHS